MSKIRTPIYNNFIGEYEYTPSDKIYLGKLIGVSDLVTFQSDNHEGIAAAFYESVDDYIELCKEVGKNIEEVIKWTPKQYSFPAQWSESKYFIYACFCDDLQQFYKDWIEQGWKLGRFQYFDTLPNGDLVHKYWNPSMFCCESGELLTKENIAIKIGYWTPNVWKPIRKDLRESSMKLEATECQIIDKSCSDCVNMDRQTSYCNFKKETVKVYANVCHPQNMDCFKHRRLQ